MENVTTRVGMPLEEFLEEFSRQPFELINGERKPTMPGAARPNYFLRLLFRLLDQYTQNNHLGEVFVEMTFILPETYASNWVTGSRVPDIMFYAKERFAAYIETTADWGDRPYAIVPDFVVEIVSPTDKYSDVDKKATQYLTDGVKMVWVFDPQQRKVRVHTPGSEHSIYAADNGILDAGDVIPGLQIPLAQLFSE